MKNINESRLYLAPSLKVYLNKHKSNKIASELLDFEGRESGKDLTLIDVEGDNFSYSSSKIIDKNYNNRMSNRNLLDVDKVPIGNVFFNNEISSIVSNKKDRNVIRIGKLINSLFPNKFTSSEIERFVDIIRAKNSNNYEFKVVSGDEIKEYYNSDNCAEYDYTQPYSKGTLGSSCMMDKSYSNDKIFDIYTKNPDVCKMLVMLNKGELVARALLWKVHCVDRRSGDEFDGELLDRIYYQYHWMITSMMEYAESKGYLIKYHNDGYTAGSENRQVVKDGVVMSLKMSVPIKKIFYKSFPYIDTFLYFDVKNGLLTNYKTGGFQLNNIDGTYAASGGVANRFHNYIRKFK